MHGQRISNSNFYNVAMHRRIAESVILVHFNCPSWAGLAGMRRAVQHIARLRKLFF